MGRDSQTTPPFDPATAAAVSASAAAGFLPGFSPESLSGSLPGLLPDSGRRPIVLATLNSRHSHASLGLRYLKANAGDLAERIRIDEFVIGADPEGVVDRLLAAWSRTDRG